MRCVCALELSETVLADVVRLEHLCFTDPWSAQSFETERSAGRLWCSMDGERLVGYIVFWTIEDECEIANIAVDPAYRGRGIGGELLSCAFAGGGRRFFLEVRMSNESAQSLYRKHGFVQYAVRKNYYKNPTEDALLLCKE